MAGTEVIERVIGGREHSNKVLLPSNYIDGEVGTNAKI